VQLRTLGICAWTGWNASATFKLRHRRKVAAKPATVRTRGVGGQAIGVDDPARVPSGQLSPLWHSNETAMTGHFTSHQTRTDHEPATPSHSRLAVPTKFHYAPAIMRMIRN
jgi:hypothetical protein